jgi:hypothetical protein
MRVYAAFVVCFSRKRKWLVTRNATSQLPSKKERILNTLMVNVNQHDFDRHQSDTQHI